MLAEFGTGQVFWSLLWFALIFLWIYSAVVVFGDIFRSGDLAGWAKALWAVAVFFFPFLGVVLYLIVRGEGIRDRAAGDAFAQYEHDVNLGRTGVGRSSTPADVARSRMR